MFKLRNLTRAMLVATVLPAVMLVAPATPAFAANGRAVAGTFTCPGNTMSVRAPSMTSYYGDFENVRWWPEVQVWTSNGWASYNHYGYFAGTASATGSGNWARLNGQPGSSWTTSVAPGYYLSNGSYVYRYYRVVNYVQWLDINENPITNWTAGFVSYYPGTTGTYCTF